MTSIKFREPYSQEELDTLYPPHLKLQLVQVVRHLSVNIRRGGRLTTIPNSLCAMVHSPEETLELLHTKLE